MFRLLCGHEKWSPEFEWSQFVSFIRWWKNHIHFHSGDDVSTFCFKFLAIWLKYHGLHFLLSQHCAVQSLKRVTFDEGGKIGRKNLTTFCIKSLAIWGGHLLAVFRVRTLQRITCVEKENKPSSLMAIMKEERKEEKLKSRGKKLRVPRPCPSIIQWRMVLVTGKICDDMFETLIHISNAHYTTKFPSIIQWRM